MNLFLKEIEGLLDKGYSGRQLTGIYTQKVDSFLQEIFRSIDGDAALCLIALGGYGRAELAPYSDIDIMFLAKDKAGSKKAGAVLYKFWDTGLPISHCFRTPEDCIAEAKKDLRTRTSLLEARFLAGDKGLYNYFHERVYPEIAYRKQRSFISDKLKEMGRRHRDFGDSVFLLEPNVKEGEGGLRDIHTVLWLSRVALRFEGIDTLSKVLSSDDLDRLKRAYDFLLKVRFCLHLLSGRRNDVLSFDIQGSVAKRLGFMDSKKFFASERLMRYFYLKARAVKDIASQMAVICSRPYVSLPVSFRRKKISDEFYISKEKIAGRDDVFKGNPDKIIEAFYLFSKTGKGFSHNLREKIKNNLLAINRKTRNSPDAVSFFLEILKGNRVYETLREMHETGALGRFVPEFGALRSLVVYEPYHRYTVDEHTLLAIKNLELLRDTKFKRLEHFAEIIKGIDQRETLFLSLLFHDIGKAAGKHHGEEGYKRLKNIIDRFNLDGERRQRIEFLVRNHILMSGLALKREAEDPEVITQLADAVGDEENLKALYLITYADMSAVNPGFWTGWKAYLLRDLYEKTLNYLHGFREDTNRYINSILSSYPGDDKEGLNQFLAEMPERYLLSTPPERVCVDYGLALAVRDNNLAISVDEKVDGTVEIIVGAWDSHGLFSRIVGVLSSIGLNILRAKVYTGKNGLVIDKIQISNWKELWWAGLDQLVEKGLKDVIIKGYPVSMVKHEAKAIARFEIFIELDNETSEESSVLEFFSSDRLGLLYDVSNLLYEKGMNIISARINTESGLAEDIFYIQHKGEKVNGPKASELLLSLWEILKS